VLTGLIKRISPEVQAHALDETDDGWLPPAPARHAAAPKAEAAKSRPKGTDGAKEQP
jgi:hypothetical protein